MKKNNVLQWILRIGIFGEFFGHGMLAITGNAGWFKYFHAFGINDEHTILTILLVVGTVDVILAILVLIKPIHPLILWMTIWGLFTSLLRWPIGGDPIFEFFERWMNWAGPLALLMTLDCPHLNKLLKLSKDKNE